MGRRARIDHDDSVKVVWHHDEVIHFDGRERLGQFLPNPLDHLPGLVQPHPLAGHLTKEAQAFLPGYGYEVGPSLCVVVASQAERLAVMGWRFIVSVQEGSPAWSSGQPDRL